VQSGVVDKESLRSWADNNQVESIDELLKLGAELKAESSTEEREQKLLERQLEAADGGISKTARRTGS